MRLQNEIEKECTGCLACMNACKTNAITVKINSLGKTIPTINNSKCVDCGACVRVCQLEGNIELNNIKKCYAVTSLNSADKIGYASGGVATEIGRFIVSSEEGVVYGAKFDKDCTLNIVKAQNEKEVIDFAGSKYLQSNVGFSFQEVEKILKEGKTVFYVGTPCQIVGLKKYLSKDYENLYTADLICHGTPPQSYFIQHLSAITNEKPDKIVMRGEKGFRIIMYKDNKEIYKKLSSCDYYYYAFLNALTYRDNCYICKYAQKKRSGDLTLGDFWGIQKSDQFKKYNNKISVVLLNTEKGIRLWEKVRNRFYYEERSIEEATAGNIQLNKPSSPHSDRADFERKYVSNGFEAAVKTETIVKNVKNNIKKNSFIRRCIRKILN